jgi:hydrogenase maturation factor
MCLGIPGEILEVCEDQDLRMGKVRFAGINRVCLEYVPDAAPGDATASIAWAGTDW